MIPMSRYELVLYFKFNRLYIIYENMSDLGVLLYSVGAAIFYNVFSNDKWVGNIFYVQLNYVLMCVVIIVLVYFVCIIIIAISIRIDIDSV